MLILAAEWDLGWIALRALHITAATLAAGGAFFQRFALLPGLGAMESQVRREAREQVARRWRGIVFTAVGTLLLTGLISYVAYRIPQYHDHPKKGLYHGLLGVKILLALGAFHCATVLALPGAKGEAYRDRAGLWLNLLCAFLLLIIIIGAVLNGFPHAAAPAATP